jgi:hypothetical protein
MAKRRRLSDVVDWSSTPVPLWRHVARWALSLVVFVALVLINASYWEPPEPGDPRLDSDDGHSEQVLGRVTVRGTGGGMPERYPAPQAVTVHPGRATICPGLTALDLPP